jgi:hypothetical protein
MFRDSSGAINMEEFNDARDVVANLSLEYEACEHPNYVSCWLEVGSVGGCGWVWPTNMR